MEQCEKEFIQIRVVLSLRGQMRDIHKAETQKVKRERANVDEEAASVHPFVLNLAHCCLNLVQAQAQDHARNYLNE